MIKRFRIIKQKRKHLKKEQKKKRIIHKHPPGRIRIKIFNLKKILITSHQKK